MTSSSEQPPNEQLPEYIINYNDVLAIRGFMIRAGYPEEQINAFEEQITAKLGEGHDSRSHQAPVDIPNACLAPHSKPCGYKAGYSYRPHSAPGSIHPKQDCFGKYQGVGDDRCFACKDWGYCADVTEAARQAREGVLDLMGNYLATNQYGCRHIQVVDSMKMAKYIGSLRHTEQEQPR